MVGRGFLNIYPVCAVSFQLHGLLTESFSSNFPQSDIDFGMRAIAVVAGALFAISIANRLVGFTSAVQIQKTLLLAALIAAALCPLFYWMANKGIRK